MPKITFVSNDGAEMVVEATSGHSLMETAIANMVPGIEADCGGACACATCHVYIAQDWIGRLEPAGAMEADMLECALDPNESSRLACQVKVSDDHDGLVVNVPAAQA